MAARRDQRGQLIELTGFGTDGRPTLNKEGYAKITFAYDARAKEIERAYFSVDGKPTLNKDAYAKVAVAYDARGNPVDRAFWARRQTSADQRRLREVATHLR